MDRRGLYVFKYCGIYYIFYNHWDSYPDGLGQDIVNEIKTWFESDFKDVKTNLLNISKKDIYTYETYLEEVFNNSNQTRNNFKGLMKAVKNVKSYKLQAITNKEPNLNYDAQYIYILDLDKDIFRVHYSNEKDCINNFKLTDIPTYWKDLLI